MSRYDDPSQGRIHGDVGVTVNADFTLVVDMVSDVAGLPVVVQSRTVGRNGKLFDGAETILTDGLGVTQRQLFNLPDGLLTGIAVGIALDLGAIGEVRVRVGFGTRGGGNELPVMLVDGYIGGGTTILWPVSAPFQSLGYRGKAVHVDGPLAAVGADATLTAPAQTTYEFERLYGALITDATVINRTFAVTLQYGTMVGDMLIATSSAVQAASTTLNYAFYPNLGSAQIAYPNTILAPSGYSLMPPGSVLTTVVYNLQAGDDVGYISIDGYRRFEF